MPRSAPKTVAKALLLAASTASRIRILLNVMLSPREAQKWTETATSLKRQRWGTLRIGQFAVRDEELRLELVRERMRVGRSHCLGRRWRACATGARHRLAVWAGHALKLRFAPRGIDNHCRAAVPASSATAGGQRVDGGSLDDRGEEDRQHQQ